MSHLARSIGGYDASNIGKANETSLQRMIDNADELKKDADFVSTFDGLSGDALRNGNIHIQPKAAKLINTLRKELGLNMIANNSGSNTTDSGTIQVQGNSQQGSAGGADQDATVVRTGNDDRTNRNSGPFRQNDRGIWLPPNQGGSA
ncbi:MAG: hypothetical protein K2G19_11995 [Lachnospiraceae bacterium]|nr:hypothetical protein [Lachnospiraceae bacterium]